MSAEQKGPRGFEMHDAAAAPEGATPEGDLPAPTFATFVLSLSTSALLHMGVVDDPEHEGQAPEPDLQMARHTIDMLEMLQEKTRGNLEPQDEQLLSGVRRP